MIPPYRKSLVLLLTMAPMMAAASCASKPRAAAAAPATAKAEDAYRPPAAQTYAALAREVEDHFQKDVVRAWFPRCVDRDNGGFHAMWSRDWQKQRSSGKFLVFQARMTWIASQTAMHRPELRQEFLGYVRDGVRFLDQVMWDSQHGGFFWHLNDQGKPDAALGSEKHVYGIAFGMYAAAAAYQATGDQQALDLAIRTFRWLEANSHDPQNGGYFEILTREGKVVAAPSPLTPRSARSGRTGFFYGHKSMNAHIHLLEALTALYEVWKDQTLRLRMEEMLAIVRDRIAVEPGCLNLWFTADWRAVPDHDSFGHDVETAFLLIEAAEALGQGKDPRTLRMARMLVDHALDWGWDEQHGGFWDKGFALEPAYDKKKVWWSEVEGLNALLLMHEHFGKETDRYWRAFLKQWQFIKLHMIDGQFGGLYEEVEADGTPIRTGKGHNWKAGYHDGRSFMLVGQRLRKLAEEKAQARG